MSASPSCEGLSPKTRPQSSLCRFHLSEDAGGNVPDAAGGSVLHGRFREVAKGPVLFKASDVHFGLPWKGTCVVLAAYTAKDTQILSALDRHCLAQLGFTLPCYAQSSSAHDEPKDLAILDPFL